MPNSLCNGNRLILFLFYLLFTFQLNAQIELGKHEYISVSKGLSDRTINTIVQDEQGFLWIGTDNGLNRYDGKNFVVYHNKKNSPFRIHRDMILKLEVGRGNRIVVIYKQNNDFIDILSEGDKIGQKLILTHLFEAKSEVFDIGLSPQKNIYFLSELSDGKVWVVDYNYDKFRKHFVLPSEVGKYKKHLRFIVDKNDASIWVRNHEGKLWHFSDKGELIGSYFLEPTGQNLNSHRYFLTIMHQAKQGRIWMTFDDRNGLYFVDSSSDSLKLFDEIPTDVHYGYFWEDGVGNQIVGDNHNMALVTRLYMLSPDFVLRDASNILKKESMVQVIFSNDFNESLLVGSHIGMRLFPVNKKKKIEPILEEKIGPDKPWGKSMKGIAGDGKGNIYIAREVRHWYVYDMNTREVVPLEIPDPETGEILDIKCSSQILLEEDTLWGGSCTSYDYGYLHKYVVTTKETQSFKFKYPISSLTKTKDGTFWVGLNKRNGIFGELVNFNPTTGEIKEYVAPDGTNPFEKGCPVYIFESSKGQLWVGSLNGLFLIDRENNSHQVWKVNSGEKNSFSGNYFMCIHEDEQQRLWLGTSGGLNIWDLETGEIKVYTEEDGLSNNSVCGIVPENDTLYWLSTFNGMTYFDTKNEVFGTFGEEDGFNHYEFNRFAFYKDYKGRMYFGGLNGVNAFYGKDLFEDVDIPPVILTKISKYISSKDSLQEITRSLSKISEITINPQTSYFQFNFILPHYYKSKQNQFSAWLEGYEKDWQYLGTNNYVRYNKLPPGTYTLHLKGADHRGNWSKEIKRVKIMVTQPFYKSIGFILLCSASIILLSLAYYRWHLYQLRRKNEILEAEVMKRTETIREQAEELKKLDAIKSRIFAIIGHDLRKPAIAFRGIVKKVNYLLRKKDFNSLEILGQEIEKDALGLNALIDNVLKWALAQQNTLPHNPEEIEVSEVVEEVFLSLHTLAKDKKVKLVSEIKEETYVVADRSGLQTILRNLLDNAIKYSPENDQVVVSSIPTNEGMDIIVKDNGVGIPFNKLNTIFLLQKDKSTKGTAGEKGMGLGLHLVYELVKANKGDIRVESELGKGTAFYISLLLDVE